MHNFPFKNIWILRYLGLLIVLEPDHGGSALLICKGKVLNLASRVPRSIQRDLDALLSDQQWVLFLSVRDMDSPVEGQTSSASPA